MSGDDSAIAGFRSGISLFSDALELIKKSNDILKNDSDREALEKIIAEAEKTTRLAEAQIARSLKYKLCNCTFPPQIMLSYPCKDPEILLTQNEESICPNCGKSSIV